VEEGLEEKVDTKTVAEDLVDYVKSSASQDGQALVERTKEGRTEEQEEALQEEMRAYLAGEGMDTSELPIEIIELRDASMADAPEVRYNTDKKQMLKTYDRGEIHLVDAACTSLLARVPDDTEVWRALTLSRLRLHLWDSALQAARRWIAFDPYAVPPRNAEAIALAGCREFGEARARFQQLASEIEAMDADLAKDMREAVWRIDELWRPSEVGKCELSARPITVITGARPPHFYLPNFADSLGPLKVLYSEHDEPGGGQSHLRKLVVTEDVSAGDPLLVQNPLVFGLVEIDGHLERLSDALVTAATTSPRAAALVGLLADDGELEEGNAVVATVADAGATRPEGPWSKGAADMDRHLDVCKRIVERSMLFTGQSYVGVWTLPGMARHSCCPSANCTYFGDTCVARAARDLRAGDEVTFSFWDVLEPLEARRQAATEKCGGFWCGCPRCQAEDALDPRADLASEKMKGKFMLNVSRTTALKEELASQMEVEKNEEKRRFKEYHSDERRWEAGLTGFSDRLKGKPLTELTEEDMDELQKFTPPDIDASKMVKVPQDLANELFAAIQEFEDALTRCELEEAHRNYFVASHIPYYSEVLVLAVLQKDLLAQQYLVQRMLPVLAAVAPGSFPHQRLAVFNWQIAAQIEDTSLSRQAPHHELAAEEKELAREVVRLRYGRDLSLVEIEAAMARTAASRQVDENWCWEVSWCIGCAPDPEAESEGNSYGASVI